MRSVRLADALYRPAIAIMSLSLALQVFCFVAKLLG